MLIHETKIKLGAVIYDDFELLDLFGPLEMFGVLNDKIEIILVSESKKIVSSSQGPRVISDLTLHEADYFDILLIPGGLGTRKEVNNIQLINFIKNLSDKALYVAAVCTGAALLAKTGLLDNLTATTNKIAFEWGRSQRLKVDWKYQARWVEDGKYFTSSGVSAGIDMSLDVIQKIFGEYTALNVARLTEYVWNSNKESDPFA